MSNYQETDMVELAGQFPPTLATNLQDSALEVGQTADAYGLDPTAQGFLKAGSAPAGTTRIAKEYTIGANTFNWYYNRLWRIADSDAGAGTVLNRLIWNAPEYTSSYYAQLSGSKDFNDDTQNILKFFPIGQGAMIFFKSTGAYIIPNADDRSAQWRYSPFIQEAKIAAAAHAVELDGVGYFSNTDGLFAISAEGQTQEISFPVRDTLTTAYDLTVDYEHKYVVLSTSSVAKFVYDTVNQKWFDYRTANSLFTSRTLQTADVSPFCITKLGFEIDKTDTTDGVDIDIATKVGNRDWNEWDTYTLLEEPGYRDYFVYNLRDQDTGRSFVMKIRNIPATIKIKRIFAFSQNYTHWSRGT